MRITLRVEGFILTEKHGNMLKSNQKIEDQNIKEKSIIYLQSVHTIILFCTLSKFEYI